MVTVRTSRKWLTHSEGQWGIWAFVGSRCNVWVSRSDPRAVSPQVPSVPSKLNHHGTTASKREAADESGWKRAGSFTAASELLKVGAGTSTTTG